MSMFQLPEFNPLPNPELLAEVINEVWAGMEEAAERTGSAFEYKYADKLPDNVVPIESAPSYQAKVEHAATGIVAAASDQERVGNILEDIDRIHREAA